MPYQNVRKPLNVFATSQDHAMQSSSYMNAKLMTCLVIIKSKLKYPAH